MLGNGYSLIENLRGLEQQLCRTRQKEGQLPVKFFNLILDKDLKVKKSRGKKPKIASIIKSVLEKQRAEADQQTVTDKVIDRNFQARSIKKDFESPLALELLIEMFYSRESITGPNGRTANKLTCHTSILNLLLDLSTSMGETPKLQWSRLPHASYLVSKHLAKRNKLGQERFVLESKELTIPRDLGLGKQQLTLGQADSDRSKISKVGLIASRTKNQNQQRPHRRYFFS